MKQVIELLEKARHELVDIAITTIQDFERELTVKDCINKVLSILKAPCWETPKQYQKRTGEPWPADWAVYFKMSRNYYRDFDWGVCRYITARKDHDICVVATEAGPPPDDWEPETQKD